MLSDIEREEFEAWLDKIEPDSPYDEVEENDA